MRFIGSLRFRPWSESTEAYASKIGPKARTAEPFDACGAFEPLDAEGKVRLEYGGLNLRSCGEIRTLVRI